MKEFFNKIIQTSIAIILCWIVVFGVMYAQQICCSAMVNICSPASFWISGGYNIGKLYGTVSSPSSDDRLQSNLCYKNDLADFGAGNTCCETDRCDGCYQTTYISYSSNQDFYPVQKTLSAFNVISGEKTNFRTKSLSTSLKAVLKYILTQSIIC